MAWEALRQGCAQAGLSLPEGAGRGLGEWQNIRTAGLAARLQDGQSLRDRACLWEQWLSFDYLSFIYVLVY